MSALVNYKPIANRWLAWGLIVSLLLVGCRDGLARLRTIPPLSPTRTVALPGEITAHNASRLAGRPHLGSSGMGGVAALKFTPDSSELLVVHAETGTVQRWGVQHGKPVLTFSVLPKQLYGGVSFDESGQYLVTAAGSQWERHKQVDDYLGYYLWDTRTGSLLRRAHASYDSDITRVLVPTIAIQPNANWMLFMVDSASEVLAGLKNVHIVGLLVKGVGEVFVDFDRRPEQDDFDVLAFDAAGDLFAAADEAGKVAVYEFRPPNYPDRAYALIERPAEHLGPRPLALSFSPTRQWLAAVRGNQLVVWPLQTLGFPRQIEALVSAQAGVTAALAFNPAGDLLAVGTSDRWQIWDVANKKLLIDEITQTPIYALTFSPDGRLFAVGDANGVVHVWGVPSQ